MTFLETSDYTDKPNCIRRINIARLINLVCRWKCFKGKQVRVKDFYIRCLLTKCTTIDKFQQILRDCFIVASSESEEMTSDGINNCFQVQ